MEETGRVNHTEWATVWLFAAGLFLLTHFGNSALLDFHPEPLVPQVLGHAFGLEPVAESAPVLPAMAALHKNLELAAVVAVMVAITITITIPVERRGRLSGGRGHVETGQC